MTVEPSICPICGKQYFGYPALSRTDNKTLICPDCGVAEAIAVFMNSKEDVKNGQRNKDEYVARSQPYNGYLCMVSRTYR